MKLRTPAPISFERFDGSTALVLPLTREKIRSLYEQEDNPEENKTADLGELRAARLALMLKDAICTNTKGKKISCRDFLRSLTVEEEIDIMQGLIAQTEGINVAFAVDLQSALREQQKKKIIEAAKND